MGNQIQVFTNKEFGAVRTVTLDNEPWFVGKDVAEKLGYSNSSKAVSVHVDDEDKQFIMVDIADSQNGNLPLGSAKTTIINESGLYSLILLSKLPKAKEFKHWVTSEVLPTLRKSGSYNSNAVLTTITPAMAVKMLEDNIDNRKINQAAVDRIASDMLMGNYAVNGTSIKFYKDGTLSDGQHRLLACVKANVPFKTYVIKNIDRSALPTIDCGRPRSLVDTLNMTGCTIQKKLVPAMHVYFAKGSKLTANQAKTLWNIYEDKLTTLCNIIKSNHHDYILSQSSVIAYLIHLCVHENWSEEDITTYVTGLKDKPNRDTPFELSCYNFRNYYNRRIYKKLSNAKSATRSKTDAIIDALCTLTESYKSNREVKSFAYHDRAKRILNIGNRMAQNQFTIIAANTQELLE